MSTDLYKLNLAFFSVFGQQNGKFHITHSALLLFTNKVHKDVRKYFFISSHIGWWDTFTLEVPVVIRLTCDCAVADDAVMPIRAESSS